MPPSRCDDISSSNSTELRSSRSYMDVARWTSPTSSTFPLLLPYIHTVHGVLCATSCRLFHDRKRYGGARLPAACVRDIRLCGYSDRFFGHLNVIYYYPYEFTVDRLSNSAYRGLNQRDKYVSLVHILVVGEIVSFSGSFSGSLPSTTVAAVTVTAIPISTVIDYVPSSSSRLPFSVSATTISTSSHSSTSETPASSEAHKSISDGATVAIAASTAIVGVIVIAASIYYVFWRKFRAPLGRPSNQDDNIGM